MTNMYGDSKYQWNIIVGCHHSCTYCINSFQRQMKRQKPTIDKNGKQRGCHYCYIFKPHFHPERLNNKLPRTQGDEFIWVASSSDISFAKPQWIYPILDKIKVHSSRTFFFQTKQPKFFEYYPFPENTLLGVTLETNRSELVHHDEIIPYCPNISKAGNIYLRYLNFAELIDKRTLSRFPSNRKIVTIEPILDFDIDIFSRWIEDIHPHRVYVGYDTKNNDLPEPMLEKTREFIEIISQFTKVKTKYMKEGF